MNELKLTWPLAIQLLTISCQRDGWHCAVRCDESWKDDTGQSLFGTTAWGRAPEAQGALAEAMAHLNERVAEINRKAPLRASRTDSTEAELLALLGL